MSSVRQHKTDGPIVRLVDVWKSYEGGAIQVLNGVTFSAAQGETVALCGPSGCGKSTLLHLVGGLDFATRGEVHVLDRNLDEKYDTVDLLRHGVGFVFQLHNLIPDLTLEENCLVPTIAAGTPRAQAMDRLHFLARRMGLDHRLQQRIKKLSGGERQRTAICRALMNSPRILLADEPTGALDHRNGDQVFELLLELVAQEGITLLMATHDRTLASRCDRLLDLMDGRICHDGGTD